MDLNFHQLRLFHTVARLGSISRAAEELRISQPSVSAQVREFELRCGVDLLHRLPRGVSLTQVGQVVFDHADRIFGHATQLQATLHTVSGNQSRTLAVGGSLTAGEYFLPAVVAQFRARYPAIELRIALGNSAGILTKVTQGDLDVVFVGTDVNTTSLATIACWRDEIVIIAPTGTLSKVRTPPTLQLLASQRFVVREEGSATRQCVEQRLDQLGLTLETAMVAGSPEAVKRYVSVGSGWGFASRCSVLSEVAAGLLEIVPVSEWVCERTFFAVHRKDYRLNPSQQEFLNCARNPLIGSSEDHLSQPLVATGSRPPQPRRSATSLARRKSGE